jgi:hypothetical protein
MVEQLPTSHLKDYIQSGITILNRIKRLVTHGRFEFTFKAVDEMVLDGLTPEDVAQSIINADRIKKTLLSKSTTRKSAGDKLNIIESFNFQGTLIYSKGTIKELQGRQIYYVFVSSKISR